MLWFRLFLRLGGRSRRNWLWRHLGHSHWLRWYCGLYFCFTLEIEETSDQATKAHAGKPKHENNKHDDQHGIRRLVGFVHVALTW